MIIFAIWKDDSEESADKNPTLPPSIPASEESEQLPPLDQSNDVQTLVTESFQAPLPTQPTQQEAIPTEDVSPAIPEPEDDLSILLTQIDAVKEEDKDNPPEPIL
jgi:hypothetical protein